jgi:hypothetical protein
MVNVYDAKPERLAKVIDKYVGNNRKKEIKENAVKIGLNNFSVDSLKQKYLDIIINTVDYFDYSNIAFLSLKKYSRLLNGLPPPVSSKSVKLDTLLRMPEIRSFAANVALFIGRATVLHTYYNRLYFF